MQIEKSKKQQAYEQAKAKYEQDIKIYRHNHDKIEDANEDDEAYDWRLHYFKQFQAIETLFWNLQDQYMARHREQTVFEKLKHKDVTDDITDSIEDVAQMLYELRANLSKQIFGQPPREIPIGCFNEDGTEKDLRQLLDMRREAKQ